jgi:deferrochelatase/peroxidase EfeB
MTRKQPPSDTTDIGSVTPTRRHLIAALGTAGSIAALGVKPTPAAAADRTPGDESDGTLDAQPFFGKRQSGVVTPQPAAAMVAAFDVLADDRAGLEKMLRILTTRISVLTKAGPIPVLDPKLPPAESGLLGPQIYPDNLTVTVSVGGSLFDDRFGIASRKPKHLVTMERFTNDALDPKFCHGDLMLQICSNTAETNIHALRDIIKNLPDSIALRWKLDGFLPPHTIKRAGKDTVRNLLGFKDGTANLDGRDNALMDRVVWVQPGSDEPAWAADGKDHRPSQDDRRAARARCRARHSRLRKRPQRGPRPTRCAYPARQPQNKGNRRQSHSAARL